MRHLRIQGLSGCAVLMPDSPKHCHSPGRCLELPVGGHFFPHIAIQDPLPCTSEHPLGPQRLLCISGRYEERRQKCHIDSLGKPRKGLLSHSTGKLVMWPHLDAVGAGKCSPWLSNCIPMITARWEESNKFLLDSYPSLPQPVLALCCNFKAELGKDLIHGPK